jgi:flagellar biosynthesis GTPase FlhF
MAEDDKQEECLETQSAPPPKDLELYVYEIDLKSAADLRAADLNGKSDPFLKVVARGQEFETQVVMKSLNPVWNERTQFCFFEELDVLEFRMYDWDKGSKHDELGDVKLKVLGFCSPESQGFNGSLNLENTKKGTIQVAVRGRHLRPIELEQRCDSLEAESQENASKIEANEAKLQDMRQRNAQLTKEKAEFEKSVAEKKENVRKLRNEADLAQDTNDGLKQTLMDTQAQIGTLKEQIEDKDREKAEKDKELAAIRKENEELEEKNVQLKDRCDKLQQHLEALK